MKIEDVVLFTCLCIMSEDYIYNYVVDNPHIISTITFEDIASLGWIILVLLCLYCILRSMYEKFNYRYIACTTLLSE